MKIAFGSDHAGYKLKEFLKKRVQEEGFEVIDVGCFDEKSVDYPDFAVKVALKVASKECDFGVLVCGTGLGMSIAANKVRGVRAAACSNLFEAVMARRHNDANILCLGSRVIGDEHAYALVHAFLSETFEGGRHDRRLQKISLIEEKQEKGELLNEL